MLSFCLIVCIQNDTLTKQKFLAHTNSSVHIEYRTERNCRVDSSFVYVSYKFYLGLVGVSTTLLSTRNWYRQMVK